MFTFVATSLVSAQEAAPTHMVEIIDLKSGKTIKDVQEYFRRVNPVVNKYGAYNTGMYAVTDPADQGKTQKVAIIWRFKDMRKLPQIFQDDNYTRHVAFRDSIMNLQGRTQLLGMKVE